MPRGTSSKADRFTESVIRMMSQLAARHGALNLAQGFPDFPAPAELKDAAKRAIDAEHNQYSVTWGAPELRRAVAAKARSFNGIACDADANVTVACGSTEAMMAAMLAIIDPGDEVVIFAPFYENYGADVIISGAKPVYVTLHGPDFRFDPEELRRAFGPKTKAVLVNTPHNPSGHVYTREELETIAALCEEFDAYCVTDEIYEHILYDGREHVSPGSIPRLADRTITISGMSKTYSVTGWRVAWAIAPPDVTLAIRKMHDFLTVGAPHPFQIAGVTALEFGDDYYAGLVEQYGRRRRVLVDALRDAGFRCQDPEGAYYVMTDISGFGFEGDDTAFSEWLVKEIGVAPVPGSSFYEPGHPEGRRQVRFTFCKSDATLEEAAMRLSRIRERL